MTTGRGRTTLRRTSALSLGLAALAGVAALAALRRRLVVVTVHGESMEPAYHDGDRVLVRRGLTPARGQVIVVERPTVDDRWCDPPRPAVTAGAGWTDDRDWMMKRVAALPGDPVPYDLVPALADVAEKVVPPGRLVLLGDNRRASFDSRTVGYFPAERVLGVVLRPLSNGSAGAADRTG
ncbi:S26 family signal peptidase [Streptosporangium sp. NPDC023615]|uniref:S26 family signal peptidase n=1 Tax=Streptosporangium sp. NPDC023615 TaxID=3154794 RepID=UPI00341A6B64